MKQTFIYGLCDPRDGRLRYVGKSDNPEHRLRSHLSDAAYNMKTQWLANLKHAGLIPSVVLLDIVPMSQWQKYERSWISAYRSQLTNVDSGGGGRPLTESSRKIDTIQLTVARTKIPKGHLSSMLKSRQTFTPEVIAVINQLKTEFKS